MEKYADTVSAGASPFEKAVDDLNPILKALFERFREPSKGIVHEWKPISMAHPDWKFGDVVGNGAARAMVLVNHPGHAEVIFVSGLTGLGSVPHGPNAAERWQLVPEPDD